MPLYNASPITGARCTGIEPGTPVYSFGSFNGNVGPCIFMPTASAEDSGNVITLTGQIISGNIPAVGQLVTTLGLSNVADQTNTPILSVGTFSARGAGSFTYADSTDAGTIASAPDSGQCLVPQAEVPEALAVSEGQQFSLGTYANLINAARNIQWELEYPSAPTSVVMNLEASMTDDDSQYQILDTSSNPGGETRYVQVVAFNFIRITCSATAGGTDPSVIAKITVR